MLELTGVMKSKKDFENPMSRDTEMYFYMDDKNQEDEIGNEVKTI